MKTIQDLKPFVGKTLCGLLHRSWSNRQKREPIEFVVVKVARKYATFDSKNLFTDEKFSIDERSGDLVCGGTSIKWFETHEELDAFVDYQVFERLTIEKLRDVVLSYGKPKDRRTMERLGRALDIAVPGDIVEPVIVTSWDSLPPVVHADGCNYSTRVLAAQHNALKRQLFDAEYTRAVNQGAVHDEAIEWADKRVDATVKGV